MLNRTAAAFVGYVFLTLTAFSTTAAADWDDSDLERSALVNFREVTGDLYRSGTLSRDAIAELADQGVKTIISLEDYRGEEGLARREGEWAEGEGMDFTWLSMDPFDQPRVSRVRQVLEAIASATPPVLVHCKKGKDRTGIVIAAYRIAQQGWSVEAAKRELRDLGHARALYWWDDVLYSFD